MTVIGAAVLIGLAVWMMMPPATRKQEGRHLPAWSGVPVGFVAAWLLFGAGGVVWAVMAVAVGQTVLVVVRRQRRRAQILKGGREVARATRALAGRVSVGEIPAVALEHVASDVEVLAQARRAQAVGGSVPDALMATSRQPGMAGLVPLAHAWHLAATTGAPLAQRRDPWRKEQLDEPAWKPPWTPNSRLLGRRGGLWVCYPWLDCSWAMSSEHDPRCSSPPHGWGEAVWWERPFSRVLGCCGANLWLTG